MKCYLTCPNLGTLAKIECDRSASDGRIVGVRSCSLAEKTDWVECDRLCVKLLNERIENQIAQRDEPE